MPDVEVRLNESAFGRLVQKILGGTIRTDGASNGAIIFRWEIELHLRGLDDITFNEDNIFTINELDVSWNRIAIGLDFDIPPIEIGGFCLVRAPVSIFGFGDFCLLEFPHISIFTGRPDFDFFVNLSGISDFIVSEASLIGAIDVLDYRDPAGDRFWRLKIRSEASDFDLVDIRDTLGQTDAILAAAISLATTQLLNAFPVAWMASVALDILGVPTFEHLILDVLDIQDDVEEWLMNLLKTSIGIDGIIANAIAESILAANPIRDIHNPFAVIPKTASSSRQFAAVAADGTTLPLPSTVDLLPIELSLKQPQVTITDSELRVTLERE